MKLQMFTVFDVKSDFYHNPFLARTKGEAIRMFSDTVQDDQSLFSKHPADFTLFHVGTFDNQTCEFEVFAAATPLGKALDFVVVQDDLPMLKEVN